MSQKGKWWVHVELPEESRTKQKHTLTFYRGYNGLKSVPNWDRFIRTNQVKANNDGLVLFHTQGIIVSKGGTAAEHVVPRVIASVGNTTDNGTLIGFLLLEIKYKGHCFSKWFEIKKGPPGAPHVVTEATPLQSAILAGIVRPLPSKHTMEQMGRIDGIWKDSGLTRRNKPLVLRTQKSAAELADEQRKKLQYAQTSVTTGPFVFTRIGPAGIFGGKKTMAHCIVPGYSKPVIDLKSDTTFESKEWGRIRLRGGRHIVTAAFPNLDLSKWLTVQIQGTFTRASSAIGTAEGMKISKKSKMNTNAFKRI